jgi:hypothetical protein
MTFIADQGGNNLATRFEAVTVLHNTSTDIACSAGTIIPLGASRDLYNSASYSVSSGVITLPSGYYYMLKGAVGAYGSTVSNDLLSYRFYDTNAAAYVGRRGWLAWQEYPKLTCGDEYAIAIIDASTGAQTVDFRIVTKTGGTIILDPSASTYTYYYYTGYCRVEIWKWQ